MKEQINVEVLKNSVNNCSAIAEGLKSNACEFRLELNSFSNAWNSLSAQQAKSSINAIIDDFDTIIKKINIVNERINTTVNNIKTVDQTTLSSNSNVSDTSNY